VPQTPGRGGINAHLDVLINPEERRGQTIGDVQRFTIRGGRLRSAETIARGVRVEGYAVGASIDRRDQRESYRSVWGEKSERAQGTGQSGKGEPREASGTIMRFQILVYRFLAPFRLQMADLLIEVSSRSESKSG